MTVDWRLSMDRMTCETGRYTKGCADESQQTIPGETDRATKLSDFDPDETLNFGKEHAADQLAKNHARMADLQYLLYAENKRALLIILQAMDAGGKDGTIRHVMDGVNPQGCRVTSFKVPSSRRMPMIFCGAFTRPYPRRARSASSTVPITRMCWWRASTIWSRKRSGRNATNSSIPLRNPSRQMT